MRNLTPLALLVSVLCLLPACFRDGHVCAVDTDCFSDEVCESGTCVAATSSNNACRPASDEQLCSAAAPCQANLEVTDSCGVLRTLECDCADTCVPEMVADLCEAASANCGPISTADSCGTNRTVNCGVCTAPEACVENSCSPCAPPVCPETAECGQVSNPCGDTVQCPGSCSDDQICVGTTCTSPILQPGEVAAGDRFGEAIKLDGDFLLVGAPTADSTEATDAGVIVVYQRIADGWVLNQVLDNPVAGQDTTRFGAVFDARDGYLIASSGIYEIYFRRDESDIYQFKSARNLTEGGAIAIGLLEGGEYLAGYEDDGSGVPTLGFGNCGDIECRENADRWAPAQAVGEIERFGLGAAIDTDGRVAIVGAPFDNTDVMFDVIAEGSYLMLSKTTLGVQWVMTGWNSAPAFYRFESYMDYVTSDTPVGIGSSVAISSDGFAIAGAPDTSRGGGAANAGQVFLLMNSGFDEFDNQEAYTNGGTGAFERCGHSVALGGPTQRKLGIASCLYPEFVEDSGNFTNNQINQTTGEIIRYSLNLQTEGWNLVSGRIELPDRSPFDHFGWTLESSDELLFVGAPGRDGNRGAVYIYPMEDLQP